MNKDDLSATIEVNRVGECFTLQSLCRYKFEIREIGEDFVVADIEAAPLEGGSEENCERWSVNVNRYATDTHRFTFPPGWLL